MDLEDFLPHFSEAFAVNAQGPHTRMAEGRRPSPLAVMAQPASSRSNKRFGEGRRSGIAAKVGKRVQHDILERAFVGEPLDVFERLAHHRRRAAIGAVASLSVDEDNQRFRDFVIAVLLRLLGRHFGMGLPAKPSGLEAEQLHRAISNSPKNS